MRLMEMTHCRIWISELKDIAKEAIQNETGERKTKNKSRKKIAFLSGGTTSGSQVHNIHVTGVLKGKVRKGGNRKIYLKT